MLFLNVLDALASIALCVAIFILIYSKNYKPTVTMTKKIRFEALDGQSFTLPTGFVLASVLNTGTGDLVLTTGTDTIALPPQIGYTWEEDPAGYDEVQIDASSTKAVISYKMQ